MERGTDGLDDRVLQMIGAAVLAGAYRTLAEELPEAERGLLKMAAKHSRRVQALAGEIATSAGSQARALAAMPPRARR